MRGRYQEKHKRRVFRKSQPKLYNWKPVIIPLVFLFLGLVFYGMVTRVKVWPSVYSEYATVGLCLSVFYHIALSRSVIKNQDNTQREKWKMFAGSLIMGTVCFVVVFAKGLPSIFHHMSGKPAEMQFRVSKTASGKGCGYGFKTEGFNQFFNDEFCGLTRESYRALKMGNIVVMQGTQSAYGFYPSGKYHVIE